MARTGILAFAAIISSVAQPPAQADTSSSTFAVINGVETPITVGSTIGRGIRNGDLCTLRAPITVGAHALADGSSLTGVVWEFDANCRAVVLSLSPTDPVEETAPDGAEEHNSPEDLLLPLPTSTQDAVDSLPSPQVLCNVPNVCGSPDTFGNPHEHRGWVKYVIQEQWGVTATEVFAKMDYWQNWSRFYSGNQSRAYCYHSGFPGWSTEGCKAYWWPYGPDSVYINIRGTFWNRPTGVFYQQYAIYHNDRRHYGFHCSMPVGSIPTFWDHRCYGARKSV